jgi:type II secretory pathway component PulM
MLVAAATAHGRLDGTPARDTASTVMRAVPMQAPADTPRKAVPGFRIKASVRQDTLNVRRLRVSLALVNEGSSPREVAFGACFQTFRAYRRRRDRHALWTYPTELRCPAILYGAVLQPGATQIEKSEASLDLPAGCYYFTVEVDLTKPRIRSEIPAGRLCLRYGDG